ncbi:putative proton-dependent oligopeptide transporter family, major facilitator superfamily [Medicago truncatula]|uniref:Putative proton-dependent oligopeptide transporter family, major facilitator superfamily n=2 Tax=Medicago truncatula TaxID=3880 RepID=A0A396I0T1_MEDTR|nr:protein NRT1/ PTR FAMILY 7.3 isoform X1 [Medicago truncatula]RHN59232.1 putative proton-dependent oligopeptide transporter family, major facilitator superfamily [Medicago truncatula]
MDGNEQDFTSQVVEEEGINSCTKDGSVDFYGKPALKNSSGRWRSATLLLVNQGLVAVAFAGVEANLVIFCKLVLKQTNVEAANTFSIWMGTTYFFSLIGAFLSDSYLGRYLTCIIFQLVFIIGLVALSLSTHLFLLKPHRCEQIGELCESDTQNQFPLFYLSIYLIALGSGVSDPALPTLGADQFDEEEPKEQRSKASIYGYFYVALNLGSLVAETILAYIETTGHWVLGFWICTCCAGVSFLVLLSGTLRYRHYKTFGNPFSKFSQLIVPFLKKMKFQIQSIGEDLYHDGIQGDDTRVRRIHHANGLRFFDRAGIVSDEATEMLLGKGQKSYKWNFNSLTQSEAVTYILRVLPIWICTIFSSSVFIQLLSLFVEQGSTMDRTFFKFQIPPSSMTAFDIISTSTFIILLDVLIIPLYIKVMKRPPKLPSELQSIGIGLCITIITLIVAGFVEQRRLSFASNDGKEMSSLSIFWLIPQYMLLGIAEAFVYVAQMNFFTSQTPDGLESLGMGLSMFSSALGCYVGNFFLTVVNKITSSGQGQHGWVSPNLNDGHLDRFFFLTAFLIAIDLIVYIVCAKRYKGI